MCSSNWAVFPPHNYKHLYIWCNKRFSLDIHICVASIDHNPTTHEVPGAPRGSPGWNNGSYDECRCVFVKFVWLWPDVYPTGTRVNFGSGGSLYKGVMDVWSPNSSVFGALRIVNISARDLCFVWVGLGISLYCNGDECKIPASSVVRGFRGGKLALVPQFCCKVRVVLMVFGPAAWTGWKIAGNEVAAGIGSNPGDPVIDSVEIAWSGSWFDSSAPIGRGRFDRPTNGLEIPGFYGLTEISTVGSEFYRWNRAIDSGPPDSIGWSGVWLTNQRDRSVLLRNGWSCNKKQLLFCSWLCVSVCSLLLVITH